MEKKQIRNKLWKMFEFLTGYFLIIVGAAMTIVCSVLDGIGIPFEEIYPWSATGLAICLLGISQRIAVKFRLFETIAERMSVEYDDILFPDRRESTIDELTLIDSNRKRVDLLQETGLYLSQNARENMMQVLKQGGKISVVLACPDGNCEKYLSLRNSDIDEPKIIRERYKEFNHFLDEIKKQNEIVNGISVRYCPYPIAVTETIVDLDDSRNGEMVVRFADFGVSFKRKLCFKLTKKSHPKSFAYYQEQYEKYSVCSYKKIFVKRQEVNMLQDYVRRVRVEHSEHIFCLQVRTEKKRKGKIYEVIIGNGKFEYYEPNRAVQRIEDEIKRAYGKNSVYIFDGIDELYDGNDSQDYDTLKCLMKQRDVSVYFVYKANNASAFIRELIICATPMILEVRRFNIKKVIRYLDKEVNGSVKLCKSLSDDVDE